MHLIESFTKEQMGKDSFFLQMAKMFNVPQKMIDESDDSIRRKKIDVHIRTEDDQPVYTKKKKMIIDPVKLETTIKKACIPIEKKNIVVLETLPKKVVPVIVPVPIAICQAKNLNGTPCKCKAKVGKFCTKHSG